jgi:peptide/nickel transport system substrate-binding protein
MKRGEFSLTGVWARSAIVVAMLLAASACTGGTTAKKDARRDPEFTRGGTLRVASEHYTYDPQKAYTFFDWEILRCCLLRTLFTYSGRPTAEGGAIPQPDLANGMGSVSADGLTWTFKLKPGFRFAPPFQNTEITAADIARGLERTAHVTSLEIGYPSYYAPIEGFEAFQAGDVDSISGIGVPDDHSLIVHLTRPAGDLPYLFTMPATAPIPPGVVESHDEDYERFLVASGPYMFEGSDELDFSLSPSEQVPVSGYDLDGGSAILVRNPSWESDSDAIRNAYADRIEIALYNGFEDDVRSRRQRFARLERGELDILVGDGLTPEEAQRYRTHPALVGGVLEAQLNGLSYMEFNLAMPPFDDLHVRRAALYAIDREEIVRGALGRVSAFGFGHFSYLAGHLGSDSLEGGLLASYDPYPEHGGDLDAARREMAASAYDRDGDGRCDDPACRSVRLVGAIDDAPRSQDEALIVKTSLRAIGIRMELSLTDDAYDKFATGRFGMIAQISDSWFPDFPNASSMFIPLFHSSYIPPACCNLMLVGTSPEQLRSRGLRPVEVPSVDDRMLACQAQTGTAQTECWAALDQYLMEQVIPAMPTLFYSTQTPFSTRVVHASIDQWTTMPALDQVALALGSD